MEQMPIIIDLVGEMNGSGGTEGLPDRFVAERDDIGEDGMSAAHFALDPTSQQPVSALGWGIALVGGAAIWAAVAAMIF